jgi:HPt (histidine-containing phosphotransfer) domain-containing protein
LIVDRNILSQDRAALGSKRGAMMIQTFGDTAPIQIGDIKSALADGRADVVAETAHALKGAASSLGLPRLAHHCGLLEARAQSPEAAQLAEKLDQVYEDSWTALENLWIELETAEHDDQVVTEGVKT